MTSTVDVTFPADNVKVSKATMRSQFLTIRDELSALQSRTGVASAKAYYNYVEQADVEAAIRANNKTSSNNLAKDLAFGRATL